MATERLHTMNRLLNAAIEGPAGRAALAELGLHPDPRGPEALEVLRRAEEARWREPARRAGYRR